MASLTADEDRTEPKNWGWWNERGTEMCCIRWRRRQEGLRQATELWPGEPNLEGRWDGTVSRLVE